METSITIKGDTASLVTPEGNEVALPLKELFERLDAASETARGVHPPGVRMVDSAGPLTVWVFEIPPGIRQLKWIAEDSPVPFGRGAQYRMVRIALPYLVILAVFRQGVITDHSECFFRVRPLEDERTDTLLYPALLNCSRFQPAQGRPLSWICTQKLSRRDVMTERDPRRRMQKGLRALCRCLLETGFNLSSDFHEASSWFSESKKVDPRVSSVEAWQEATRADPLFTLNVPWLETGKTVQQVVDRIFENCRARRRQVEKCADLARWIVHNRPEKPSRPRLADLLEIMGEPS